MENNKTTKNKSHLQMKSVVLDAVSKTIGKEVFEQGLIPTSQIIFRKEIVDACKSNSCGKYNTNWCCAPAVGSLQDNEKTLKNFAKCFVFTTKHFLEDSFDFEGMLVAKAKHQRLTRKLCFLREEYGVEIMGAGCCEMCKKCSYPNPCVNEKQKIKAIESVGIDVVELAKLCDIHYHNGEKTVTYFSAILFD